MLVPLVLNPRSGDRILDLCAAPGAKTAQIAALAPQAQIVAFEKSRTRYYKLLNNLKIQGVEGVRVMLYDGIWVRKKYPEYFDKVLIDAPCSVEGRFFTQNPKSFKYWSKRKVQEMVRTQKQLLHSAFFSLQEEGTLVYSTCSNEPEENEGVIDFLLNKFDKFNKELNKMIK